MLIGELAARSGTTRRALRYYEDQGLLVSDRDPNGYRHYDADAELRVQQIRALLAAGFSSSAVARLLPCASGQRPAIDLCPRVVAEMEAVLSRLERHRAEVDRQAGAVRALLTPA